MEKIMKKIILSSFLVANSMAVYAADSLPIQVTENVQRGLCNKAIDSEQKLSVDDKEKLIFISMDYYREYENRDKNLLKDSLSSFTLVNNNAGDPVPFGLNVNSRYLVSIKYRGQEVNDGTNYIDQDGKIKQIKYPFENKNVHGNIYTTIDKSNNKVNMKLCMYKATETQDGVNDKSSLYKESTVQFNEPTIIDLNNGYKVKITLHKYTI